MTDFRYPKTKRLLNSEQFKAVFNKPLFKVHSSHLMAFVCQNNVTNARLGMAVTKKKLPTAVARNQVKRLIKEQFRLNHAKLPEVDIVFILKQSTKEISNQQITKQINDILNKIVYKTSQKTIIKNTV